MDLSVDLNGLVLKNPVMTASGTFGYAVEYRDLVDLDGLGGIIVKGLSLHPSTGNPNPRVVETACGMLNAVGLENVGLKSFVTDKLPFLRTLRTPVLVNIYGKTVEEYRQLAAELDRLPGIAGVEVNISCPNVEAGGAAFGVDPDAAWTVVSGVRKVFSRHVMVKLSPNVTDIVSIALAAEKAGADSVSLINTITGMAIDVETRRPILSNVTGGLSGPAVKPVALRMVWQVARRVGIPVVGIGGIQSAEDAVEFMMAGASAVQVGTANLVDPGTMGRIIRGIRRFMAGKGIDRVRDITGSLIV
jgi:dihydroorotate dehydrogenase (NAD+) catalytic subunit